MCVYCGTDAIHATGNGLRHPVTRRQTLDMLAAGGLAAMFGSLPGGFSSAAHAADDDVVRIGYLPITDATALLVAHAMGYFTDEGLTADRPTLIRGWSPLVEAFAAGKFNLVHLLKPIPVWMRYNNNFPVKIMAWAHTNGSGVIVGGDTGIKSFTDLGGKQIAVPFWYSMHNIVLQYALRQSKINPVIKEQSETIAANECNLQVMQPPDMPAALAAKKIDGYIVAEPFNALGEVKAGGRMLRFTGDIWKNHPCCVLCMNEDVVTKKPEWTQKVMNALVRAEIYASGHKQEVAKLLSTDGSSYLPLPAPIIERAMTYYDDAFYGPSGAIEHPQWHIGRIDFQPWPYPSATKLIVKAMNETVVGGDTTFLKKLDPDFVAKDLVNYDYIRNAMNKYPDWKNDPSVNPSDPFNRTEVLAHCSSLGLAVDGVVDAAPRATSAAGQIPGVVRSAGYALVGIGVLLAVWWIGGWIVASNPATVNFAGFAPGPTLARLWRMLLSGEAVRMTIPSLGRIGAGLAWAIALGVPCGILIGRFRAAREASSVPFQFLRMISPLAWMPIAIMAFSTWDRAIIFLVAVAAIWPVLLSTAHGFRRIDPAWFKVARNLGARPWHMLFTIILPAIAQDSLTGIRLAVGVAWIVLVPAEFLGVTSGLGYAINDARDTLEYDRLAATVLIIGFIGFTLDQICEQAIRRASWIGKID